MVQFIRTFLDSRPVAVATFRNQELGPATILKPSSIYKHELKLSITSQSYRFLVIA